jgi:acetyl-CoA/propionyl-CoA carboxylase, biotin carboxylase, biotin carboxyl carrier protein
VRVAFQRPAEALFSRILIANRGEIAVRVARTCRDLGVECVAVHSDADRTARHVALADRSVRLPGVAPDETYLNAHSIIDAARSSAAEAIHPGYGFLSENPDFAARVRDAGLVWIGPPPDAIRALGNKISARRIATEAGVAVVPGLLEPVTDAEAARSFAREHGYPIAVKAAGGGGGRGLKVAASPQEIDGAWSAARREAAAYFGSSDVYVERYLESPKHLEVQLLAPNRDEAMWLGVRDCSLQRRHQKLVEETPPPKWGDRADEMGAAAIALSKAAGYVNAGTVELLVDESGDFYFLEVNSRLQVEHTVTEEVYGIDLVACQLRIAAGDELDFTQTDLEPHGHAIECRINAEDPARQYMPAPGRLDRYVEPGGLGVRVDSGYAQGDEIPSAYDSLLAKLVTWGRTRQEATARMRRALDEFVVEGVATTIPVHRELLAGPEWGTGSHTTTTIETTWRPAVAAPVLEAPVERRVRLWNPAMSASIAGAGGRVTSEGEVVAPMQGTILDVLVRLGQQVAEGEPLIVLEAMKMETKMLAPRSGTVVAMYVAAGDKATAGQILALVE